MNASVARTHHPRTSRVRDGLLAAALGSALLAVSLIALSLLTDLNDDRQTIKACSIDVETVDGQRMATITHSSLFGRRFYLGSLSRWSRARVQEHDIEVGTFGFDDIPNWVLKGPLQWVERGGHPPPRARIVLAIGWPMQCLWCEMTVRNPNDGPVPEWYPIGGLKLADRAPDGSGRAPMPIVIPLRPLLTPFAVNFALYIAAAYLARIGLRNVRCFLRRRRGLCPACAYDLRATPPGNPCPECGRIPTHTRTTPARPL